MTRNQTRPVFPPPGMTVTPLVPRDPLRIDPAPLAALFADLGEATAEEVVCRALDDLVRRLERIEDDLDCRVFSRLGDEARRMIAMSRQIGLTEVAMVAGHVAHAVQAGDGPALGATVARLGRIVDRAISEIWTAADRTA